MSKLKENQLTYNYHEKNDAMVVRQLDEGHALSGNLLSNPDLDVRQGRELCSVPDMDADPNLLGT